MIEEIPSALKLVYRGSSRVTQETIGDDPV